MANRLSKITTQWTEMEDLAEEGPNALVDFLAAQYFEAVARTLRHYRPSLDELKAHELASDVLFEFIKNDYRGTKRLDRNRGHLRGLFYKIIKAKLSQFQEKERDDISLDAEFDQEQEGQIDIWSDIYIDLHAALDRIKEERPKLYTPFVYFYLEGKTLTEIGEELEIESNAVKQRLHAARRWFAESLEAYQEP